MRDFFERFRVPSITGETRATRATPADESRSIDHLSSAGCVAQRPVGVGNMGNTRSSAERATGQAQDVAGLGNPLVAQLPRQGNTWATRDVGEKPKNGKASQPPLALLPMLPTKSAGDGLGDDLANAIGGRVCSRNLAAVLVRGTVVGDVWFVADDEALAENPDVVTSGLPVFLFDEVRHFKRLAQPQLVAAAVCKRIFPSSRLQ